MVVSSIKIFSANTKMTDTIGAYPEMFFARVNSLYLQEFQRTFHPGNLVNEFSLENF